MNIKNTIKKIVGVLLVVIFFVGAMMVLNHSAQNGRKTDELLPAVSEEPIYVECEQGKNLEVAISPTENFSASGFQILLVNFSSESRGSFQVMVQDSQKNVLINEVIPVNTITPGEWFVVPAELEYVSGEEYTVVFKADGSNPYFMQIKDIESAEFSFTETVIQDGQIIDSYISMGINVVTPVNITYGDILYYSELFCVIAALFVIVLIIFGKETIMNLGQKIPAKNFFEKYGNDMFLLIIFVYICLNVLAKAYFKGAYISADSAGYLREAVNIVNGNGFSYDGLAGYRTWFANWPIVYPAMIAFVMMVTKFNAYLASKIVAMLVVGIMLLILKIVFKKDAWIYGLCFLNIGFMNLTYYTWSEIPFMLFLMIFTLVFAEILKRENPKFQYYLLFGISGIGCFLTRYFGIYVWIVAGCYLAVLLWRYKKEKNQNLLRKIILISITSFISGCICIAYLFINKIMNGMPSGVSRSIWWDDYEILTNDLIESLLTEFTNVFSIQIPQVIEELPYNMKVWVIILLLIGIVLFVKKKIKPLSTESVMISMGVFYYLIFIVIRYRSSMDSFYFRFFEPASFLICIGLAGLVIPMIQKKEGTHYFAGAVTVLMIIVGISMFQNGDFKNANPYYQHLTSQWDREYSEIPQKSVIIFNDIDFRSSYYRPDVVGGLITPQDNLDTLKTTYYGSDYLCIKAEYVATMLESGEYEQGVVEWLTEAMEHKAENQEYIVLALK